MCSKCLECPVSLINTALMCEDTFQRTNCYYWLLVYSFKALAKGAMEKPRSNPRDLDKDVRNALAPFSLAPFNLATIEQTTVPLKVCSFKQCFENDSFFLTSSGARTKIVHCILESQEIKLLSIKSLPLFFFLYDSCPFKDQYKW